MSELINDTVKAQWQELVSDAAQTCAYNLDEELESYLVFALIRFTQRADLTDSIVALEYMNATAERNHQNLGQLREVGDKCLLFSGLYPKIHRKRGVNVGYYVDIGRASYSQLGQLLHKGFSNLYQKLAEGFVFLTDILHAIREMNGEPVLDVSEKYDFWLKFDSQYSKRSLTDMYQVLPFKPRNNR